MNENPRNQSIDFLRKSVDWFLYDTEALGRKCSVKAVFLEISQNSRENNCAKVSFLIKLQALACNLFKKRLWRRCFLVNYAKFPKRSILTEHLQWLFLMIGTSVMKELNKRQYSLLHFYHYKV